MSVTNAIGQEMAICIINTYSSQVLAVLSITSLVMTGVLIGFVTRTTHGNKSEQCHRYPMWLLTGRHTRVHSACNPISQVFM